MGQLTSKGPLSPLTISGQELLQWADVAFTDGVKAYMKIFMSAFTDKVGRRRGLCTKTAQSAESHLEIGHLDCFEYS